ncbi:hypothetical protein Tco_1444589, partial [Tanacetum coccineum]
AKLETLITFNATATASPSSSTTTSSCHFPRRTPTTQPSCSSSVVRCQSSSNATDALASNASSISALEQLKTSAADILQGFFHLVGFTGTESGHKINGCT